MITLKPQDIVVLLKITAINGRKWTYLSLSNELFMSASEVHSSIKRATIARLWDPIKFSPFKVGLLEFLIHGVKYAFPANSEGKTRGLPTAYAAPPLNEYIMMGNELPFVWPTYDGQISGIGLMPLYKTVPQASSIDKFLYELLCLLDTLRVGRSREKQLAEDILHERITKLL